MFYVLSLLLLSSFLLSAAPSQDGLLLHLDANRLDTLVLDEEGRVKTWKSLTGEFIAEAPRKGPRLVKNALGKKPVLRFRRNGTLKISNVLKNQDSCTVFVVYRREGKKHGTWQKVITNGTGTKGVTFDTGQETGPMSTRVLRGAFRQDLGPDLWLGTSSPEGWGTLTGDIAEILVYGKTFFVEEPIAEIVKALEKKWGFKEDRENDWTRGGPLPKVLPEHKNPRLPRNDQANAGKWWEHHEMWDEFNGSLDTEKWWDHNPSWYGRPPARFLSREIEVKNGKMHLSMRKDPTLPAEKLYGAKSAEYRDYSSGTLKSKKPTLYGMFEIRARPMSSAASSAWWFAARSQDLQTKGVYQLEIDVFEIGARSPGHEHSYNMNAHVFRTPTSKRHWNKGGTWKAPFKLDAAFHTYGLEWTPEFIRYYVDGVLVRSMKNTHWHAPMYMIFDSETMGDWLGMPQDRDLPSTFRVDYVRAWKNKNTSPKWWEKYRVQNESNTPISRYVNQFR